MPPRNPDPPGRSYLSTRPFESSSLTQRLEHLVPERRSQADIGPRHRINFDDLHGLFRSQSLDGHAAAATHERNDKMPGRNGEFDSSVADETATDHRSRELAGLPADCLSPTPSCPVHPIYPLPGGRTGTSQISLAYSLIVRSEENQPMCAVLRAAACHQACLSRQRRNTERWASK
jgi:hypothetical protein